MITAHSQFTIEGLKEGHRLWLKGKYLRMIFCLILFSFSFFAISFSLGVQNASIAAAIGAAVYVAYIYAVMILRFKLRLKKNPAYGQEIIWSFNEQGYELKTEGLESKISWQKLHSAIIAKNGFLLLSTKQLFHWIPAEGFATSEDFQTVRTYIQQSGVKVKTA